eukprot:1540387-Lingulodinium_polyedra.AAC.1
MSRGRRCLNPSSSSSSQICGAELGVPSHRRAGTPGPHVAAAMMPLLASGAERQWQWPCSKNHMSHRVSMWRLCNHGAGRH